MLNKSTIVHEIPQICQIQSPISKCVPERQTDIHTDRHTDTQTE